MKCTFPKQFETSDLLIYWFLIDVKLEDKSIALLTHSNPIPNHEQKRTLEQNPEHRDYDTYRRSDLIRSDLVHRNVIYYLKSI